MLSGAKAAGIDNGHVPRACKSDAGRIRRKAIVEAADASAVAAMMIQWGDIFSFTTAPALTDEELGAVLAAQQRSAN